MHVSEKLSWSSQINLNIDLNDLKAVHLRGNTRKPICSGLFLTTELLYNAGIVHILAKRVRKVTHF